MTLPNKITVFRFFLSPILFILIILSQGVLIKVIALIVFLTAALTDLYDGYLARKYGDETEVGKVIDPLADKFLITSAFLAFYLLKDTSEVFRDVKLWVIIIILGREAVIMAFRYIAVVGHGNYFPASGLAKLKTLIQNIFIGSVLLRYAHWSIAGEYPDYSFQSFDVFHKYLNYYTLWLVIFLTTVSGVIYIVKFRHLVS
ncbi:MAG: CDP-diacylglycerol--glycerol-3-phosphate 3-phosphatidyltransferase [Candidatus Glassbacteria bacterium]